MGLGRVSSAVLTLGLIGAAGCAGSTSRYELAAPQIMLGEHRRADAAADAAQMTLAEAYHLALDRSERVAIARTRVDEADIQRSGTWNAYTPTIGMTESANVQHEKVVGPNILTPGQELIATIRLQQPLFRLDFSSSHAAAVLGGQSAEASVAYERERLARDVARAFVDVLRTRRLVELAHASVQRTEEQEKHATARVKAGQVLINATLLATVDVKRADRQLAVAQRDASVAEVEFLRLVGRLPPATLVVPDAPALPDKAQLMTIAAKRRDLRALQLRVSQARAEEDAARARRWWPRLDLVAGATATEPAVLGTHWDWQVLGLVTIPILQSGREYVDVNLSHNKTHAALLALEEQAKFASEEVAAAQILVSSANEVSTFAEQQLTAAQQHYNLVDNQFKLGAVTFLEVTNAQAVLVEAENTLAVAKMDQVRALFDFEFAAGLLDLDQPSQRPNAKP